MHWVKIIYGTSKLLTSHTRSIILIGSLLLVGLLAYGFSLVESAPETAAVTFMWMYFVAVMISLGIIIAVLYLANRTD